MEFDNDRPVKHPYKIEIYYWVLLGLINPLVNAVSFFPSDFKIWPVLLLANLVVFPAYILFSTTIVPRFLFQQRYKAFIMLSLLLFVVIQVMLFIIYTVILKFDLSENEQVYFGFHFQTIAREALWVIINMTLAVGVYFTKMALDEKKLLSDLDKENGDLKLKTFRSQLNPHFLFNTLNSIYSLSLQKSDQAPEVVVKLSDLMRYMIDDCNEKKVPLNKEIEFIRNYIDIEKIRYKADVRFSVEGETDGVMIEPFLFISFIENGFKHAFNSSYTNAFIYITIKVERGVVALSVVNNTNIDMALQAKRMNGTGMRNSKGLLELLYPASYELDIIQTHKQHEEKNELRIKHAKDRLETLYPDSHTLDVILSNNAFTVSLILKPEFA
jgi:two-component system, LytTR family, sensor kinase